jgi:hypothetical protein
LNNKRMEKAVQISNNQIDRIHVIITGSTRYVER